jgi:hypothetical protein
MKSYFSDHSIEDKLNIIHYYGHEFKFFLQHIRSNVDIYDEAKNTINEYTTKMDKIFREVGTKIFNVFTKLIESAEESWDEETATKLLDSYFRSVEIADATSQIEKLSRRLLIKINKFDNSIL